MDEEQKALEVVEMTVLGYEKRDCEWCLKAGCAVCEHRGYTWWWKAGFNMKGTVTSRISAGGPNIQRYRHFK